MSDIFKDAVVELNLEVSEMETDISGVVVLDRTRVQEILNDYEDEKPQFPVLRVEAGTVSKNGNLWPEDILDSVAEQINSAEIPGFWGHIPPEQRGYVYPDPETLWLGATVKKEAGKKVLYVKGYNHPESRARKHRRLAKVTSWMGKASGRVINGVRNVETFALESIDWARPGSNGMSARVVAWASEMEDERSDNDVDWAKITLADIQRENPALFTLMKQQVEAEQAAAVQEMKEKADKAEEQGTLLGNLRKLLKIDEEKDIIEAVTEIVTKVEDEGKKAIKDRVAAIVGKKVTDERAKATIMRLIPVSEMEALSDKDEDAIKGFVEGKMKDDEDIAAVVSEMSGAPAPLSRTGDHSRDGSREKVGRSGMVRSGVTKL